MNIQKSIVLVALTGAIGTLWFEYVAAVGFGFLTTKVGWWMTVWALLPYGLILAGSDIVTGAVVNRWFAVLSFLVTLAALYAYYQALIVDLDAQSALIFLFMPLLQSMFCVMLLIILKVFQNWPWRRRV